MSHTQKSGPRQRRPPRSASRLPSLLAALAVAGSIAAAQAATTSDPFPALRVGLGGAAAFAPGADSVQGGFALDVNFGLILHRDLGGAPWSVNATAEAARGGATGRSNPLVAPRPQLFFGLDAGYHYQGSAVGGHRGLFGMSLGVGQAALGWAVAYTPRFVAGQAGEAMGIGARNGLSAFFFGTTFGLEVAHQVLFVRSQPQHEAVVMITLNPLTPLVAYALHRRGQLSQ